MTPSRRARPPSASGAFWPPLRSRPARRCCWRATCPARRWRSRGCCARAVWRCWRSSTSPTRSRGRTSRRRCTSRRRGWPTGVLAEVEAVTARAARALGLREGPIHAELRVDGERVSVLELAARSIGGLCSRALRFGAGVSLEQVILRHALGLGLEDLARESAASGVMMIPIPAGWRAARGRGAGGGAGGGGHRRAGDHDRPRPPRGAAARRRPLPGLPVRARGERRRGRALAARRARAACGSGSSRTRPSRSARASVGHPCASC